MNNFRTELKSQPSHPISHKDQILTAGSCFADHLGHQLKYNKFDTRINPLGVSYNPLAIHQSLLISMHNLALPDLFVYSQDTWKHLLFHSQWVDVSREALMEKLNRQLKNTSDSLRTATVLILTYGTAWTYRHVDTGQLVTNCHKLPSHQFEKFLLTPSQIIESFKSLYESLQAHSPHARIILTVSPVRHTRDTLELNNVSKSVLRLACHFISGQFNRVEYFPSYEIMVDDLRDYRFYEADMIHPSTTAREYIFDKFAERFFEKPTLQLMEQVQHIQRALAHKPFQPTSPSHQKFLGDTLLKLEELNALVDVTNEINSIKSQLI